MIKSSWRRSVPLAIGLCGCAAETEAPSASLVPVIQTLLVAGDSQQISWVEWRVPSDSAFGREVRPVDPAVVQISLILPNGASIPFLPTPGVPGRFVAAALVVPGGRYALRGAVAGLTFTAETSVPDSLAVLVPAGDTVDGATCVGGSFFCDLPYRWSAFGAVAYMYFQSQHDTLQMQTFGSMRDPSGVMTLLRDTGTVRLTFLALEENAAAFMTVRTPKGSVSGIFGMFGAATRAERWIVWP